MRSPALITLLLLSGCFSLAVVVEPRLAYSETYRRHDKPVVEVILGEARRLLATHFYTKADVYFHSGFYPSIFDEATERDAHMATDAGAVRQKYEAEASFL